MNDVNLRFETRQEIACARSACKRLIAAAVPLPAYQIALLTDVTTLLAPVGADAIRDVALSGEQARALRWALMVHRRRLPYDAHAERPGSPHTICTAVFDRLPVFADWPNDDVVQLVRLGYGDLHGCNVRSLEFLVDMPDQATLAACLIDAIGDYNRFHGADVAAALGPLWDDLSTVTIGRAGSPLLLIRIPATRQQRNGGNNTHTIALTDHEQAALIDTVTAAARATNVTAILYADSDTPHAWSTKTLPAPQRTRVVRLWWD